MSYLVNATPTSGAQALFLFKAQLLLATTGFTNWIIRSSSNGTVMAYPGDVILSEASLTTPRAWFVAQGKSYEDNGSTYHTQICVQTDGGIGLRVKIAFRTEFGGGTPSPTQTPSAADEQYLLGGGTDAAPTYTNFFAPFGHRMQGLVSEDNETLCFLQYPIGGGAATSLLFIDRPLPNPKNNGGALLDKERICFYAYSNANSALVAALASEATGPRSLYQYGTADQLWGRCPPQVQGCYDTTGTLQVSLPGGCATSPIYGEPTVPEGAFIYRRRAAVAGILLPGEVGNPNTCDDKGQSVNFRFGGQTKSTPQLLDAVNPYTGCVQTNGALAIGDFIMPWSGDALLV